MKLKVIPLDTVRVLPAPGTVLTCRAGTRRRRGADRPSRRGGLHARALRPELQRGAHGHSATDSVEADCCLMVSDGEQRRGWLTNRFEAAGCVERGVEGDIREGSQGNPGITSVPRPVLRRFDQRPPCPPYPHGREGLRAARGARRRRALPDGRTRCTACLRPATSAMPQVPIATLPPEGTRGGAFR